MTVGSECLVPREERHFRRRPFGKTPEGARRGQANWRLAYRSLGGLEAHRDPDTLRHRRRCQPRRARLPRRGKSAGSAALAQPQSSFDVVCALDCASGVAPLALVGHVCGQHESQLEDEDER
jgi:hypothetical protein